MDQEKNKGLWHAFTVLADQHTGLVQKSKLKVLTNNIGNILGFENAEKCLDQSALDLSFHDYMKILQLEFFSKCEKKDAKTEKANLEAIFEICWTICKSKAWEFSMEKERISNSSAFLLWKLFNFLAEMDANGDFIIPMMVDCEEVERIFDKFVAITGQIHNSAPILKEIKLLGFSHFLNLFEMQFLKGLTANEISQSLQEVYDAVVEGVMKKGMLSKWGNRLTNWKSRWFVLKPKELSYYTAPDLKDLKGSISITKMCEIKLAVDKTKPNCCKFILHSDLKDYELVAPDMRTKNEWMTVLQKAIVHVDEDVNFEKREFLKRIRKREVAKQKIASEEQRRLEQEETMRKQLDGEKQARVEAEAKLQEETLLRETELAYLKELELEKKELQRLLEEERQAKRDEEMVRAIQARVLEEEFQKREELEKLKLEQEKLLQVEQQKREGLEDERKRQAEILETTQQQLRELEAARKEADLKLEESVKKMRIAEVERSKIQIRMMGREKSISAKCPFVTHRGEGAFSEMDFMKKETALKNDKTETAKSVLEHDASESELLTTKEESAATGMRQADGCDSTENVNELSPEETLDSNEQSGLPLENSNKSCPGNDDKLLDLQDVEKIFNSQLNEVMKDLDKIMT